jgi:hypothetical protein
MDVQPRIGQVKAGPGGGQTPCRRIPTRPLTNLRKRQLSALDALSATSSTIRTDDAQRPVAPCSTSAAGTMTGLMRRSVPLVAVLAVLAGCGANGASFGEAPKAPPSPNYSVSDVQNAFGAEGLTLHLADDELRSNNGFSILLFDNPKEAEARAGIYQYDAALGQPEAIYRQANLVIYATQRLDKPVDDRVKAALTRLSRS